MSDETQSVSVSDLKRFAEISRRHGTQDAFVDVALQWAENAGDYVELYCHPRIAELEAKIERVKAVIERGFVHPEPGGECPHGVYSAYDCVKCYDAALMEALE